VLDDNQNVVKVLKLELARGVNSWRWDLIVDQDAALKAERDARAKSKEKDTEGALAKTPYAEAVRLQQRLYIAPGKYTVKLAQGAASSETSLEVKAPEARKPRAKPEPKLRGKDKWARPEADPAAAARAGEREAESAGK